MLFKIPNSSEKFSVTNNLSYLVQETFLHHDIEIF